jgi:hypothetical protein
VNIKPKNQLTRIHNTNAKVINIFYRKVKRMEYQIDMTKPWFHGSNLEFDTLREGSTITQWRELAEAFATQPTMLEYEEIYKQITHNGTEKGILYLVDEQLIMDVDIYQHPRTTMDKGIEFLTKRPIKLKRIE